VVCCWVEVLSAVCFERVGYIVVEPTPRYFVKEVKEKMESDLDSTENWKKKTKEKKSFQ
jgi:hypothetical protein